MQIKATVDEMKNRALELMRKISLGDKYIKELEDENRVNMSEQYIKSRDMIDITFGCCQKRTYFDTDFNMYDVYPYVSGLPEVHDIRNKFEQEYGYFVYHMHYMQTTFGRLLTLLYLPDYDDRYGVDDVTEDDAGNEIIPNFTNCWDEIENRAAQRGFLPCCTVNLDYESESFGDVFFCTTDNGCFMRLA